MITTWTLYLKLQKNLMQAFKSNYKNANDCIVRYIEHSHYQVITSPYQTMNMHLYPQHLELKVTLQN